MCLNPSPSALKAQVAGGNGVTQNKSLDAALTAHLCVAKKKQLQLYRLTEEKLLHHKDISVKDNPVAVVSITSSVRISLDGYGLGRQPG